ncbi:MAG: PEP-CTERM sorting domain-containing protein [Planctomycetes bacterium]|nr:PEP-CTERM sorting domain-containing protein [Planctomycetota bacterium]
MGLRKTTGLIAAALLIAWPGNGEALGGFVEEFTDKDSWIAAVGRFTTIDFTGFPDGTFITDQYADLGVLFVGGNESIFLNNSFPNDGAGLRSPFTDIVMEFDEPQLWIAVDFPGLIQFELFSAGELIYSSSAFGVGGAGNFAGLLSTEPFDMVAVLDPSDQVVNIDDLHFGVPAPATLALLALGGLFFSRRRRS